jgi:DNA-binding MarR family transcriptional regulator
MGKSWPKYLTSLIITLVSDQPDLLFLLHDLARQLRTDADRRAAGHGLTRAQWVILFWLERQPGLSQKELAELLDVEPISVARLIDRLEGRGMVERRADANDRRIWRLHLRPTAEPALIELHEERAGMLAMTTAGLDEATLAVVRAALCRMKSNVIAGQRPRATHIERPSERPTQRNVA